MNNLNDERSGFVAGIPEAAPDAAPQTSGAASQSHHRPAKRSLYLTDAVRHGILLMILIVLSLTLFGLLLWRLQPQRETPLLYSLSSLQTIALSSSKGAEPSVTAVDAQIPQTRGDGTEVSIPVTYVLPQQTDAPVPLVVYCHGFTGNRQGDGHFLPLAQRLAQNGIACVSLDFPGNGDSAEPFTAYTLQNMLSDLDCVIHYLCQNYPIRSDRIGLVGHSMGGRIVSLSLKDSIAAAALWSPANNNALQGLEFIDHDPEALSRLQAQALQDGSVLAWNVPISSQFIEEMAASDPWSAISQYQNPLLIAFAGQDTELLSQDTIDGTLSAAENRGAPFTNLTDQFANATHNYTAPPDLPAFDMLDDSIRNAIESATADFFCQALLS